VSTPALSFGHRGLGGQGQDQPGRWVLAGVPRRREHPVPTLPGAAGAGAVWRQTRLPTPDPGRWRSLSPCIARVRCLQPAARCRSGDACGWPSTFLLPLLGFVDTGAVAGSLVWPEVRAEALEGTSRGAGSFGAAWVASKGTEIGEMPRVALPPG